MQIYRDFVRKPNMPAAGMDETSFIGDNEQYVRDIL